MFENLSDKLQRAFKNLRGQGTLTEENIQEGLREIRLALLEADVNFKVVKRLITRIREKALGKQVMTALSPTEHLLKIVRDEMVVLMGSTQARIRRSSSPPSVYLVVGLQGSGKTTSSGKLALWLSKQGRKPLLVSVDVYRPAAREQLAIVAGQIGQPVYRGAEGETTALQLATGAVREARQSGRDTVLIDTAGRLHVDSELMQELEVLKRELSPTETLFVADAMTGQDAVNSAAEFHDRLALSGIVLSKMDGDARGGAALSIREVTGCPIKFLGIGEKPREFEVFHPDRVVSRLLGMGDILTFIEKAEAGVDKKREAEWERRLQTKQFTLDDFREQIARMQKMGSFQSIIDMIPKSGPFKDLRGATVDPKELVRTEAIINSMTAQERANAGILNGSRRRRIAAGSGTSVQQVNSLLKRYRDIRDMMSGMSDQTAPGGRRRKRRRKSRRRRGLRSRRSRARPGSPRGMGFGRRLGR